MHRLFGSGGGKGSGPKKEDDEPEKPKPTLGDAARSMDDRAKQLDNKIQSIDKELLRYKEQLKKAAPGQQAAIKKRALATVQRKKMYEKQRDSLVGQQFNIEQTSFALDTVADIHIAISAMRDATKTLQVEQQKIDVDELEDIQDDLFDLLEEQEEIQDIMSRNYETPDGIDEDDLDAELAGLEDVFDGIELESGNTESVAMPTNPDSAPQTVFTGGVSVPAEYLPPSNVKGRVPEGGNGNANSIGMM